MSERKVIVKGPPPEGFVEQIIAEYGSLKAFEEAEAKWDELVSRFFGQIESLAQQYPDKFVAMGPGDVLVVGDSAEEIIRRLDEKGVPRGAAIVQFLDVESPPLVL